MPELPRCGTLAQDLTAPDMLEKVTAVTAGLDIGLLIYNAGSVSHFSPFLDDTLDETMRMVRLGRGRADFAGPSLRRGYAQTRPGRNHPDGNRWPAMPGRRDEIVYSAGKAYSRTLAEGLWYELKPFNVHVLGADHGLDPHAGDGSPGPQYEQPGFSARRIRHRRRRGVRPSGQRADLECRSEKARAALFMVSAPRAEAVGFMAKGAKDLHG